MDQKGTEAREIRVKTTEVTMDLPEACKRAWTGIVLPALTGPKIIYIEFIEWQAALPCP